MFGCRGVSQNIRGDVSSSKGQCVEGPRGVPRRVGFFSREVEEDIKEATPLAHVAPDQEWTGSGVVK